jgi:hypothetical protein
MGDPDRGSQPESTNGMSVNQFTDFLVADEVVTASLRAVESARGA